MTQPFESLAVTAETLWAGAGAEVSRAAHHADQIMMLDGSAAKGR